MEQKIYKALADINREIKAIGKTEYNPGLKFNFRGIDNILNELHPLLAKYGVIVARHDAKIDRENWEQKKVYNGNESSTRYTHVFLNATYTFIAEDGSAVESEGIGEAMDTSDKAVNKAFAAAYKYVLQQMFSIPTEDKIDPDYYSPGEEIQQPQQAQPQQQPAPAQPKRSQSEIMDEAIRSVQEAKTVEKLKEEWEKYDELLNGNKLFRNLVTKLKLQLENPKK